MAPGDSGTENWYLMGDLRQRLCYESHSQDGARSLASEGQAARLLGIGPAPVAGLEG